MQYLLNNTFKFFFCAQLIDNHDHTWPTFQKVDVITREHINSVFIIDNYREKTIDSWRKYENLNIVKAREPQVSLVCI